MSLLSLGDHIINVFCVYSVRHTKEGEGCEGRISSPTGSHTRSPVVFLGARPPSELRLRDERVITVLILGK